MPGGDALPRTMTTWEDNAVAIHGALVEMPMPAAWQLIASDCEACAEQGIPVGFVWHAFMVICFSDHPVIQFQETIIS